MFVARGACAVLVAFVLAVVSAGCGAGGGLTAAVVESKLDNAHGLTGIVSHPSCAEVTKEGSSLRSFECTATYSGASVTMSVLEAEDGGLIVTVADELFYVR